MRLIIRDNYQNVSEWVSKHIADQINSFKPTADRPFVLGLATGSSPIATYKGLIELNKAGKLSFEHVITFNMDEYVGIAENHPESYHAFMYQNFFNHININKKNIHILNGNALDLDAECDTFEAEINKIGGIHLFLGGMGVDGHLAFNEPGSSLRGHTHRQKLTYETLLVNSRFFDNDITQVPKEALSVGVDTVCKSKEVVLIVTGHSKARALHQTVEAGISQMWTASALQLHPNAIIACDEYACAELKVGTYRYFKEMES